jgi:hypothetical protein
LQLLLVIAVVMLAVAAAIGTASLLLSFLLRLVSKLR